MKNFLSRQRILKLLTGLFLWLIGVVCEDWIKDKFDKIFSIKTGIMSLYVIIITFFFIVLIIGLFVYWKAKDKRRYLYQKIDFLERQNKMQSAILLENIRLGILQNSTITSIKQAGLLPDDFRYFGYSEEEIRRIFQNT